VFVQHLVVPESLAEIVQMALPDDLMPTEALRAVHHFAIDYWHAESTKGIAPSPEAMRVHFDNLLAEHEIDLYIDPEDTLTWAIEALKGNFIDRQWQPWVRTFSTQITAADVMAKPGVLTDAINALMTMQAAVTDSHHHADLRIGVGRAMDTYLARADITASAAVHRGARFGFPAVDEHTALIRPGELAIVGGVPKVGKSWMSLCCAKASWDVGEVPVVVTLENSVEMTEDRMICLVLGIDYSSWQRGLCTEEEIERVRMWRAYMATHERPFHIISPDIGQRTVEHIVRQAKSLGDVLIIDQLTYIEPNPIHNRLPRYQQLGHSLHELKGLINSGRSMPCVLMTQISRDGQKRAEKAGRLEMYDFAEAAEIERTADWAFGMFATQSMRDGNFVYFQGLAARRANLLSWQMTWRPWQGYKTVDHLVRLDR
jgi:DnaB-like helicase C terminal domain